MSRKTVLPLFEDKNGLLLYPLQYEGNESSRNIVYGGGVSAQQILPQNLYYSTTNSLYQNKSVPHFFFTAGYKIFMSDYLTFMPSVMVKEINPIPVTYDITGKWGFQMTGSITESDWSFNDKSKTTAEIIKNLYNAIREAAGDMYLIGCNTISHLSAGVFPALHPLQLAGPLASLLDAYFKLLRPSAGKANAQGRLV